MVEVVRSVVLIVLPFVVTVSGTDNIMARIIISDCRMQQ